MSNAGGGNSSDREAADIRSAVTGDGAAYARLILHYRPILTPRMRRFARGAAEVDELVHDVFVEAYFALPRYRADAPFEHWLQRIATRVGYRHWKRRRSDATGPLPSKLADRVAHAASATLTAREADEALWAVLARLAPRDRLVVTLMYLDGHSIAETAELTGWSQTMVKVQAYRARAKLRKMLSTTARHDGRLHEALP